MIGRRLTRWTRWRTVLLCALLLVPGTPETLSRLYAEHAARERALAALAPGRNALPAPGERHQAAPPAPSGAYPPCPLNHTFDAETVNLPGSPTNVDFETAATDVGSPPSNFDFASGALTGWTPTGSPAIGSDATQGSYASLPSGAALQTANALTLDGGAQFVRLKVKGLSAATDKAIVEVLSGTGFGTTTQVWSGQDVKLKVRNNGGTVGVDDVGVQRAEIPGWTIPSGAVLVAGPLGGSAVKINGSLTSSAFTLPSDVQQLFFRYRASDPSGTGVYAELLRGPTFGTVTALAGGPLGGPSGVWKTYAALVTAYAGETVKLRFRPQLQAVYVDDAGIPQQAVPGWTLTTELGFGAAVPGADGDGTYVTGSNGSLLMTSSPLDTGVVDTPSAGEGRSYLVTAAIGQSNPSQLVVTWIEDGTGTNWVVLSTAASTPTGVKHYRFTLYDTYGTRGRLQVKLTGGGKIYAIGDNVARQQMAEPFSQQAGVGIDTSTGSFGTSETDLTVRGGPLPLVFTRYYRGHSDRYGELGYRWSTSFDTYLGIYDSDVAVVFGSGKEEFFDENGGTYTPVDVRVKNTLTKYTNPPDGVDYRYKTKDNVTYNFEGDGDLIGIVDPNGNAITLYRDPVTEVVTSITDPGGRALDLSYDGNGRLTSVTGPDGAEVDYTYDGDGDLVAVDKPEDARTEYAYSKHRLTQIKQRQGDDLASAQMVTILTNTLDQINRVVAQTDAAGKTVGIAYLTGDDQGITRVTDQLGEDAYYYFDLYARTTHVVTPRGDVTQWVYDDVGNLQSIVDPATNAYLVAYNGAADPTSVTDPLGNPTAITWDAATHRPTQVVDARGVYTVNTYDAQGNLIQTVIDASTDALGNGIPGTHLDLMTVYTVDAAGRVTSQTVDPVEDAFGTTRTGTHLDLMTRFTYDAEGNKTGQIVDPALDAEGNTRSGTHLDLAWSWTYDDAGRVTSETRPNGHITSLFYDPLGRLIRVRHVRDGVNEDLDLVWDFAGNLLLVEDALGHQWTWTYDARNLPLTKTDPLDDTWSYGYDDAGRLASVTDPLGHVTAYAYDADGRLRSVVADPTDPNVAGDELNLTTSYAYDDAGRLANETVDPGAGHLALTTAYAYDEAGQLTGLTLPNGGVWTNAYDAAGNLQTVTDPELHASAYAYDIANRLTAVTDPLGHETDYAYDAAGRRTQTVVDPGASAHLALTTAYSYDAGGRLTAVTTDPGAAPHLALTTAYGYDEAGNLISETNPESETTWFEYDVDERLVEVTDPLSRVTAISYDAAGRRTSVARLGGRRTTYGYDARDLLTRGTDELDNTTSYTYDAAGRRTSVTNPRGYATTYGYDAADRLTAITDALDGAVGFAYDAAGRITDVTNPRGKTTAYAYDALGNVTSETDPLDRERTATYDLLGRLATATDARGVTLDYSYDDAGRLRSIGYPAFGGAPAGSVGYAYDAANRQTGMTDPTGTTGWVYDAADRVTQVASPQGTVGYAYDGAGRRTGMTLPGGKTTTYGYDAAGQLTSLLDWQNVDPTTYTYNANGQLTGEVRPNGVETAYRYDAAWRPNRVEHADGATLLARYADDLDANGNRAAVHITGSAVTNGTESYAYDELDRLTEATYPAGGGTIDYAYDADGNRVERTSGSDVTDYSYDDADQLTETTGADAHTYGYDEDGNRVSVDADTFAYDWRDRLAEATVGGTTVDYASAGDNLRATRDDGTATTGSLWDRVGGLPQVVAEGNTDYVWGAEGLTEEVDGTNPAGFPLLDLVGSVRLRTDDAGAVVGTTDYEAFGGLRAQSGVQGSLGWTGEPRDADTGLTYLRARDYAPGSGRFLQRDAVQPGGPGTQGWNRYAYAANDPATLTDPTGHDAGYVNWQASINCSYAATGLLSLQIGLDLAGVATPALVIGGFTVGVFALVGLVIAAILAVVAIQSWCSEHGCALPSFDLSGWIRGKTTAGLTDFVMGVGGAGAGVGAAAGAAGAGAASLAGLDPLRDKADIVANCPKQPKPDERYAKAAGVAFGTDLGISIGESRNRWHRLPAPPVSRVPEPNAADYAGLAMPSKRRTMPDGGVPGGPKPTVIAAT
jgi:RHS repeat-associated protein